MPRKTRSAPRDSDVILVDAPVSCGLKDGTFACKVLSPSAKFQLYVQLVLDTSLSMRTNGGAEGVKQLLRSLAPFLRSTVGGYNAQISLNVSFFDEAFQDPLGGEFQPIGDAEDALDAYMQRALDCVHSDGTGTNIAVAVQSAAASLGAQLVKDTVAGRQSVGLLLLCTDGRANRADTNASSIADSVRRFAKQMNVSITTAACMFGNDPDAGFVSKLAEGGSVGYAPAPIDALKAVSDVLSAVTARFRGLLSATLELQRGQMPAIATSKFVHLLRDESTLCGFKHNLGELKAGDKVKVTLGVGDSTHVHFFDVGSGGRATGGELVDELAELHGVRTAMQDVVKHIGDRRLNAQEAVEHMDEVVLRYRSLVQTPSAAESLSRAQEAVMRSLTSEDYQVVDAPEPPCKRRNISPDGLRSLGCDGPDDAPVVFRALGDEPDVPNFRSLSGHELPNLKHMRLASHDAAASLSNVL